MLIGEIVEKLIYIKDHNQLSLDELDAINEACNILDYHFNRFNDSYELRDNHITSIIWVNEDIKSALEEKEFATCKDNINAVLNYPGLRKYIQERGTEAGWDVIHNAISDLSDNLIKLSTNYAFKVSEIHGMIKDKFYIVNKNDKSLCALDNHAGSNTGLPIVFNTEKEAEHYLACVTDANDAIIEPTKIHFFNNGAVLFEENENGIHLFSFDE